MGAGEGSKPRLSRSTLFNIIYSLNTKEILNVTQYAYLIVWVPRKGVKLVETDYFNRKRSPVRIFDRRKFLLVTRCSILLE